MKKIILKYLSKEATFQEKEQLKNWLKDSSNHNKFKEYLKIHYNLNIAFTSVNIEKAYHKFLSDIQPNRENTIKDRKETRSLNILKYAAIFIGIIGLGFGIIQYLFVFNTSGTADSNVITLQLDDGTILELENVDSQTLNSIGNNINKSYQDKILYNEDSAQTEDLKKYNTLSVPYGKNFTIVLSDGSEVILNSGSKLTYPIVFLKKDDEREVRLEGEAFFKIKNDEQPFTVYTEQMGVNVLGTSFNVTAYKDVNSNTSVVLVTGNVNAFSRIGEEKEKKLELIPGERAIIEGQSITKENVDVKKYIAWTSGRLIFIDDSFETITRKLERKYDVTIVNFYPQLNNIAITANFKSENIDEVLKTFQQHTSFNFIKEGKKIIITPPKSK